jgi:Sugar (and other) transporter
METTSWHPGVFLLSQNGLAVWCNAFALQMAPAFLLLVGFQFLPFSPVRVFTLITDRIVNLRSSIQRWLLEQGRDDEARAVIIKLHGNDEKFAEIRENIQAEMLVRSRRLGDLWSTAAMRKRTLVAVGVQVFGQFSGINGKATTFVCEIKFLISVSVLVINYFGPRIYEGLGLDAGKSLLVQGIYGAVGPITNFL